MADSVFIDTNVLVYANWTGAIRHVEARETLARLASQDADLLISRQILREYLAVVTRPQGDVTPMSVREAVESVGRFTALFSVIDETADVAAMLLDLVTRYEVKGRVIHDATIVASMSTSGVRRILTANPADFRRFADIIDIESLS